MSEHDIKKKTPKNNIDQEYLDKNCSVAIIGVAS